MPDDFHITSPDIEEGTGGISVNQDLVVTWDPPQPNAEMKIYVTAEVTGVAMLLTCTVNDDGQATILAPVVRNFLAVHPGSVGIQLRRGLSHRQLIQTEAGTLVHVDLIGHLARTGSLPSAL
ncbi:hypothetical protein ACFL6C_09435 [Myxococcota bacterium]